MLDSTSHVILTKKPKTLTTPVQRKFNQLKEKVRALQEKQSKITQQMDDSLQFYYAEIHPLERMHVTLLIERVKLMYQFYQARKGLPKDKFRVLRQIIVADVDVVLGFHEGCDVPDEIKKIFKDLYGSDYDEAAAEELELFKESMQEMFAAQGADIDFSDLSMANSPEEMMQNIFRTIGKSFEEQMSFDNPKRERKKTKKQLEKERKEKDFLELQQKSIGSIYKKLVLALHPDLEQDSNEKLWKEELVKKVTTAYKNNDLYALLAIEMEWINRSSGQMQSQNDEQFGIYNSILKDQVRALEDEIDMIIMHPKYMALHRFYHDDGFGGMQTLRKAHSYIKYDVSRSQELVESLKTPNIVNICKDLIADFVRKAREEEEELFFF